MARPSLLPGLLVRETLEELVAHHGDAGQEDAVLLEVHLVVPVAVQVAHQLLEGGFVRPFLQGDRPRVETGGQGAGAQVGPGFQLQKSQSQGPGFGILATSELS